MKINLFHTSAGHCTLTNQHSRSNYGMPVLVLEDGAAYGPGDCATQIEGAYKNIPLSVGYLQLYSEAQYSPEELAWIDELVIDSALQPYGTRFQFGASCKNGKQLIEIERLLGHKANLV
jgi:hypothetical protein